MDVKIISGSSLCYLSLLRNEWKDHEDLSVFWKSVELSVVRLYVIFRCWEMSERTPKTFQFSGSQLSLCYFWLLRNEWEDHEDLSVFWKSVAVLVFLWNCQDLIIFYRSRIKLSRKTKVICVWILNLIIFFSFFSLTRWSLKNQSTFLLSCSRFNKGHYFYPSKMIFGTSWF